MRLAFRFNEHARIDPGRKDSSRSLLQGHPMRAGTHKRGGMLAWTLLAPALPAIGSGLDLSQGGLVPSALGLYIVGLLWMRALMRACGDGAGRLLGRGA